MRRGTGSKGAGLDAARVLDSGDYLLLALGQLGYLYDAGGLGTLPAGHELAGLGDPLNLVRGVVDAPAEVLHDLGGLD